MKEKLNTFEVTFYLEQRGKYTDWIAEVVQSGLNSGEAIYHLDIYHIPEHEMEIH
jgi:hypothetical protein